MLNYQVGPALAMFGAGVSGYVAKSVYTYHYPVNEVFEAVPYVGTCVPVGTAVALTVSLGPPTETKLTIEPGYVVIEVGETVEFAARIDYSDGSHNYLTYGSTWVNGHKFTGTSPGTYPVSATWSSGYNTVSGAAIVVVVRPGGKDDLAAGMASDPTAGPGGGGMHSLDPNALDDFPGFSSLPPRDGGVAFGPMDGGAPSDLGELARNRDSQRSGRDDQLRDRQQAAGDARDQAWDRIRDRDTDDWSRQGAGAAAALGQSRQQGRAAIDADRDARSDQQARDDRFVDRMTDLSKPVPRPQPAGTPQSGPAPGDSGGLTSVTVSQRSITISLWDHGTVDGDEVSLIINGAAVIPQLVLKGPSEAFRYDVTLPSQTNRIEVKALNTGTVGPNTATISTSHVVQGKGQQVYSINQGESASYGITVSF